MIAIDAMRDSDWPEVRAIYRAGLRTGIAAFMKNPPSWKAWNKGHLAIGRLVVRDGGGRAVGWAALTPAPDT